MVAAEDAGPSDGSGGYRAIDHSFVTPPPRPQTPGPSPIPAGALQLLEPAGYAFNARLAATKTDAERGKWHWTRQYSPVDKHKPRLIGNGPGALILK